MIAGVFILSITNVIFPKLSRLTAENQQEAFQDVIQQTIHSSLFFVLPMAGGLMSLAQPLVSFLYGGGEFDSFSISITSQALIWVSLGMVGYGVQNIVSRAYFAKQDGKTPLIAGAISIAVNLVLCMLLTDSMQVAGLAISSAVSSTVYALLLLLPLQWRGEGILNKMFLIDFGKMLVATVAMVMTVQMGKGVLIGFLPEGKLGELLLLGLCAALGVVVYAIAVTVMGLSEAKLAWDLLKRKGKRG